ncbi:CvpA family protein [Acinetobacter sp. WCHAc010052]|uniref:CvpA family protein n=1 Tax=Acinetobacter sp. WCHAc010052 TaxID=2004647 RepID=UPI000B3C055E|nr:CvpA family protein [Acinetobacter sp. WCHAc010052]AXY59870.1 CvpA family protein [Acinetobacter sp. WCHAc010052]
MNALDIFILILLLIGGLNGLRHGFVKAFANLVGWIFALIVAAKYATAMAPLMVTLSEDPVVQKIAAFAFIVLIIVVLTWLVTALLSSILKTLKLGPLNRLAGGAFGTLKGLMVVLIGMQGIGPFVESSPHWKNSKAVQTLLPYAPLASELSKDAAHEALDHIRSTDAQPSVEPSSDAVQKNRKHADESTNNPFY